MRKAIAVVSALFAATVSGTALESTVQAEATPEDDKMGLTQLLTSAMSKMGPKEITEPAADSKGAFIDKFPFQVGGEATPRLIPGNYQNTTRKTAEQFYTYMWKHACAFSKWTPTNQYLHAHRND